METTQDVQVNPSFTVSVSGKEITFTSAFARLDLAWAALAAQKQLSDFARSLLQAARERKLSTRQVAWIHKLATDATTQPRVASAVSGLNLGRIVEMFDVAAAAQKRAPRIVLQAADGSVVVLRRAGNGAKNPGTVAVTDNAPFGVRAFFCRIERDGSVVIGRGWTDAVHQLLQALAANPLAVAGQHGIATGSCCFCGRPLSTKESRSVGYGPVCAEKFGFAWGHVSDEVEAADRAAKAALGGAS